MENISRTDPIGTRDIAYYRRRFKNRVFGWLVSFFEEEAKRTGVTKRDIANRLKRDPAAITRWLTEPSNLTLETISDILRALEAEMDMKVVRFSSRAAGNYAHPIMDKIAALKAPTAPSTTSPSSQIVHFTFVPQDKASRAPSPAPSSEKFKPSDLESAGA